MSEEVKAIKDEISSSVRRDMLDFAYYPGWHVSEIHNVTWKDGDLDAGIAWISDPKNEEPVSICLPEKHGIY